MIDDLINSLEALDVKEVWKQALQDNEEFIVELNSEDQLFEKGINSQGVSIADYKPYTPFSVKIKKEKGQPTGRVTLRDEGDFHLSFYLAISDDEMEIKASDEKVGSLSRKYGESILGLTESNLNEVVEVYVRPAVEQAFKKALQL